MASDSSVNKDKISIQSPGPSDNKAHAPAHLPPSGWGGGQWKKERSPSCGLQLLPLYLHVGCLGDEVDRHPVQHILGLRISKRGHIIWEALALQQALHLLHDKGTRDSAGQSWEKEKEVNQRLLFTRAFFTGSTTHMLSLVYFLTLQKGIV